MLHAASNVTAQQLPRRLLWTSCSEFSFNNWRQFCHCRLVGDHYLQKTGSGRL